MKHLGKPKFTVKFRDKRETVIHQSPPLSTREMAIEFAAELETRGYEAWLVESHKAPKGMP